LRPAADEGEGQDGNALENCGFCYKVIIDHHVQILRILHEFF
jgi:hypothetical protein